MTATDPADADRIAARVASAIVLTLESRPVQLRDLWKLGPCVTVFVRQFGCLFCHQMVDDVIAALPSLRERAAQLVIVGNGTVEQAREFYRRKELPRAGVTVLTDPDLKAYAAAGFERGYARTFLHPGAHLAHRTARRAGHRISGVFGDVSQLGGVLVVKPPANAVWLHKSMFAGDHPNVPELIAAIPAA